MKYSVKWIAYIAVFSAFAAVMSYLETLIPFNIGIPGVKPGFANLVIVLALYEMGKKEAFFINIVRILIVGFMFGNLFSILFSISGALISLGCMIAAKKIKGLSLIGISIVGGVTHNIGQIIVAAFVVNTFSIVYYIPVLIISGLITGLLIGILCKSIQPLIHSVIRSI